MPSKFITNENQPLSQVVKNAANKSVKFDFLVGYFFFSGFHEIQDELKNKKLRILVGMDIDVDADRGIREYSKYSTGKKNMDSKFSIRKTYPKDVINAINGTEFLDSKEVKDTFQIFKRKLLNGTLQIRKTREPNHAKMYLFYADEKEPSFMQEPGKVIVGSSNFSYQGLSGRNEVNIYLQDSNDFTDAVRIFEDFWDTAVDLVDELNKEEFIEQLVEHTWLEQIPSPYLMYLRVLYEYFKINNDHIKTPGEITHDRMNQFLDISYQIDAIREGVQKVKKHSGVIIADVVGLGKSIIASTIAANLDLTTVIVTPPHLVQQWEDYAQDFGLRGFSIYTPGKIDEAVLKNRSRTDLLIIVDEAHRYRNENTEAYGLLHQLCAGNKVILLSATPFNNKPEDIFSMIKLFQIPAHSTIQTVNDLGDQMENLSVAYKKLRTENRNTKMDDREFTKRSNELALKIREILDPVVIRRTRVDLEKIDAYRKDLEAQHISFPTVKPPKELEYSLGVISSLYMNTLELLTGESLIRKENIEYVGITTEKNAEKGFIGARYKPLTYLKPDEKIRKYYAQEFDIENFETGQRNMAQFMQQLFVRRFESSKYSFLKTVQNVLNSMNLLKNWYEKYKVIPLYKKGKLPDFETLDDMTDDTESSLFSVDEIIRTALSEDIEKGLIVVKAEDLKSEFIADLDHDIKLFQKFYDDWKDIKEDPKFECTLKNIQDSLKKEKNRKIILFTEFSDTADYLFEQFKKSGLKTMMYSSKVASKTAREQIRACFDAGYPENMRAKGEQDIDVLVATDAISEGFSLHRAGTIYNYDIPYNPTRVIQRVGRINRINKRVFDELFIYNFFPTPTGETVSHTQEISIFKMKLFQAILGSDTQILKADETTEGYMAKQFIDAENNADGESWDVSYRNELHTVETDNPETLEKAKNLPHRSRSARKNVVSYAKNNLFTNELFGDIETKGVLLFSRKGDAYRFGFASQSGRTSLVSAQAALELFKCAKDEQSFAVSDGFYAMYQKVKEDSGVVKTTRVKSRNLQEANAVLKLIRKMYAADKNKSEYLEGVTTIANKESFPVFYLKQIKKIDFNERNVFEQLQAIIPENYLESLREKDNKVGEEPETILLAEEFI